MIAQPPRTSALFLLLFTVIGTPLLLPNVGCGSSESTTEVSVRVTEYITLADLENPMPDAEVCETDTENCVLTDADGMATLALPSGSEASYTITKEGYGSYLVADVVEGGIEHWFWMFSDAELTRMAELMGTTYPWDDTGVMLLRVYSDPGVVFVLVGETANSFYFENGDTPSTEIDATTFDGRGGFTDLAEGEYQVEYLGGEVLCQPFTAWPGDADNRIRVPVRAGYISYASQSCGATGPL